MPHLTLSVLDHGFDDVMFELRRKLGELFGKGLAKWVTERSRGQFLVIELPEGQYGVRLRGRVRERRRRARTD